MKIEDFQLSCELPGHKLDVRSVAKGKGYFVTGSRDKTAKIWTFDGLSYTNTETLSHHTNYVSAVLVIQELDLICTASNDSTICIYRYPNPSEPMAILKGHSATVCALAQGNSPNVLLSGSWDKTARIWTNIESSQNAIVIEGHEAAVWAVAKLASGKYATGSADKNICIWNEKGSKLVVLKGHKDCVRGLLSLPDGSLLSCSNDAVIRHWNSAYECIKEFHGHNNYIYSIARSDFWGEDIFVSASEDSTIRMWSLKEGALGGSLPLPAESVWSVAGLPNGDIVTGSSDAMVRIFSICPDRFADEEIQAAFNVSVDIRIQESSKELGGMNVNDLPGPESLLVEGKEGQTRIVRQPNGKILCYQWKTNKWDCVGDVTGASDGKSGKQLYEGQEYDFVFNVNLTDDAPCIKLPYNRGEDPWFIAQKFIHKHNLPQIYLDQVANFIVKNTDSAPVTIAGANSYFDPFTGGHRYIPGSGPSEGNSGAGNADPLTGGSSYTTHTPNVPVHFVRRKSRLADSVDPFTGDSAYTSGSSGVSDKNVNRHFPHQHYVTIEKCDLSKILVKMKELNGKIEEKSLQMSNEMLEEVVNYAKEAEHSSDPNPVCIEALKFLFTWPTEILFPVLDITRLIAKNENYCRELMQNDFMKILITNLNHIPANQMMVVRCLVNMNTHESGRLTIILNLNEILEKLAAIKSGSPNLQIAIASFFLNLSIGQCNHPTNEVSKLLIENLAEFVAWAADYEAIYRSYQAIGNVLKTKTASTVIPMIKGHQALNDKILFYISNDVPGYEKLNECSNYIYELLI